MDRRDFFRRAAIVASGAVAVQSLDLLDRLGWIRRLFTTGGYVSRPSGIFVTRAQWDDLLQEDYIMESISSAILKTTPFKEKLRRPVRLIEGRRFGFRFDV